MFEQVRAVAQDTLGFLDRHDHDILQSLISAVYFEGGTTSGDRLTIKYIFDENEAYLIIKKVGGRVHRDSTHFIIVSQCKVMKILVGLTY